MEAHQRGLCEHASEQVGYELGNPCSMHQARFTFLAGNPNTSLSHNHMCKASTPYRMSCNVAELMPGAFAETASFDKVLMQERNCAQLTHDLSKKMLFMGQDKMATHGRKSVKQSLLNKGLKPSRECCMQQVPWCLLYIKLGAARQGSTAHQQFEFLGLKG